MSGWKRLAAIVAALATLAADSWVTVRIVARSPHGAQTVAAAAPAIEVDAISRFRTERQQLRARQEAQLNEIIHSESSDGESVSEARSALIELLNRSEQELTLEGVLQSRGFEDALVTVYAGSVNVIVRREALTQQECAIILELVMRQTGVTGGNVKIIPVK